MSGPGHPRYRHDACRRLCWGLPHLRRRFDRDPLRRPIQRTSPQLRIGASAGPSTALANSSSLSAGPWQFTTVPAACHTTSPEPPPSPPSRPDVCAPASGDCGTRKCRMNQQGHNGLVGAQRRTWRCVIRLNAVRSMSATGGCPASSLHFCTNASEIASGTGNAKGASPPPPCPCPVPAEESVSCKVQRYIGQSRARPCLRWAIRRVVSTQLLPRTDWISPF